MPAKNDREDPTDQIAFAGRAVVGDAIDGDRNRIGVIGVIDRISIKRVIIGTAQDVAAATSTQKAPAVHATERVVPRAPIQRDLGVEAHKLTIRR